MIYCFGDSHVSIFSGKDGIIPMWELHLPNTWDKLPQFRTCRLGAFLAYSIGREEHRGRKMLFEALKEIPEKSKVLLIFGEIDCRVHSLKQAQIQQKSLSEIVIDCVMKYFKTIKIISEMGYEVIVFGGIPNGSTIVEHHEAARLFDFYIKQECSKTNVFCLSIWDKLINEHGKISGKYYMDSYHMSQAAMPLILEKLNGIS